MCVCDNITDWNVNTTRQYYFQTVARPWAYYGGKECGLSSYTSSREYFHNFCLCVIINLFGFNYVMRRRNLKKKIYRQDVSMGLPLRIHEYVVNGQKHHFPNSEFEIFTVFAKLSQFPAPAG